MGIVVDLRHNGPTGSWIQDLADVQGPITGAGQGQGCRQGLRWSSWTHADIQNIHCISATAEAFSSTGVCWWRAAGVPASVVVSGRGHGGPAGNWRRHGHCAAPAPNRTQRPGMQGRALGAPMPAWSQAALTALCCKGPCVVPSNAHPCQRRVGSPFSHTPSSVSPLPLVHSPLQVAAATSMFLVLFSSSLSVAEFSLMGRIPFQISVYFCALAVTAALVGLTVIRSYIARYAATRPSSSLSRALALTRARGRKARRQVCRKAVTRTLFIPPLAISCFVKLPLSMACLCFCSCRTGRSSFLILLLGGVIGASGILLGTLSLLGLYGDLQGISGQVFLSVPEPLCLKTMTQRSWRESAVG